MTDQELKDLVASTAILLNKTDKQLEKLRISQNQTDEQMKRTDEKLEKLRISQNQTDEQMKKTDKKLNKIGKLVGNMSNNQGDIAEEFFYNSLSSKPTLAGIKYDFIDQNILRTRNGIKDEYDILMVNGKDIAIIEVKYKAHKNDIIKLATKKYDNFKVLYPEYKNYNHHIVIASFKINEEAKNIALDNNIMVLQRKGDLIETLVS